MVTFELYFVMYDIDDYYKFKINCIAHINVLDSNDCKQCPRVLAEIEHIDDDADGAGINFVKIDDRQMAKEHGVFALPAVLFFKLGSKDPVIYAGNQNSLNLV